MTAAQSNDPNEPDLFKTDEVADKLRMSERFVLDEIRRKNLRAAKFGGAWHVRPADLQSYIDAHANVRPVARPG
jgi:excisionase family DNA binding protein